MYLFALDMVIVHIQVISVSTFAKYGHQIFFLNIVSELVFAKWILDKDRVISIQLAYDPIGFLVEISGGVDKQRG